MFFQKSLFAAVIIATSAATPSLADGKPKGAKKAPAQQVANFYAGKTQTWKSCNGGGIYYGGQWQAQAYCNKNTPSVGIGTWSVNAQGRICHDLTWYWREDGKVKSNHKPVGPRNCDDVALAPDGNMWARWVHEKSKSDAWWNLTQSENVQSGNKLKGKINRMRRQFGI